MRLLPVEYENCKDEDGGHHIREDPHQTVLFWRLQTTKTALVLTEKKWKLWSTNANDPLREEKDWDQTRRRWRDCYAITHSTSWSHLWSFSSSHTAGRLFKVPVSSVKEPECSELYIVSRTAEILIHSQWEKFITIHSADKNQKNEHLMFLVICQTCNQLQH